MHMTSVRQILRVTLAPVAALSLTGVASGVLAPAAHAASVSHAVKVTKVSFKGTYTGTIAMLWDANTVSATAVKGTGVGTLLGKSTVIGKGTASTSSTCDPLWGAGSITGGGSKLLLKVVSSSATKACAAGQSAPTTVTVTGVAKVIGGAGKYKGASGTLKISGSFQIQSNTAGSHETDSFKATLSGVITIRK